MLVAVDQLGVYERWDWIRAGCEKTIKRTGAHFRPEDVYVRLRNGTAWLYAICVPFGEVGFVVLTQEYDPDGMALFIWILWAERGQLRPVVDQFYTEIDGLAAKAGAKRIRWQSPRNYTREGCKRVAHIYEREVSNAIR